jgi:predicted kinase
MIFDRYDPNAARLQPTINEVMPTSMERMGLAFQSTSRGDSHIARSRGLSDVFDTIITSINEDVGPIEFRDIGGEQVPSRITINPAMFLNEVSLLGTFGEREYRYAGQQLFDNVLAYEEANPGSISPEILNLMSFDAVEQRMAENAIALRQEFESVAALPGGSFVEFVGQFAGGMQDIADDPLQAASMFVGGAGAKTLYAFAFREALIGAGFEAARQPQLAEWYGRLGIEYSSEDFFRNVGFGAAAGAGFAVGAEAIGMGLRRAFGGGQRPPGGAVGGQPTSNPDPLNLLSTQQLREGVEAMRAAGVSFNSEASAAFTLAQRIEETQSFNFGLPPAEYARNLSLAELGVAEGKIPEDLLYNTPSVATREALQAAQPEMDNLGGVIYRFDPRDIQVDARTFQFKGGGDEFGVTDRLRGITKWNPRLAGTVTIYEYADGRLFVADGHQRVGLARRLMAEDPNLNIELYGYRLREVDGVSPEEAMVQAAMTNIAQGTGTVIDAAKIARMDVERFRSMIGRDMPPTSEIVRQARDMQALSDDAFGAVINEVIPSNYGAIVGRLLADRPELQQAAISVLARAEPANVFQAEAIVRQVREADFDVATQQSLFGEEMVVESLYTERARVLDRAVKTLRQDRAAFANLVRNAENIESAGNVLDRSVNQRRADLDGQAIALVQTLANRKGPLSDALSDAARLARDTGSYGASTRQFVESIRRAITDGDFERLTSGEVGRVVNDTPPSGRSEVGKEPSLAGFDEPTGHGPAAEQQVGDLEREMFPEPEPAPAVEVGSIDELRALVQANADRAQLDQHPTVVRALEEMDARPETIDLPGYASNEWHSSRIYTIDGQEIAGTAAALREWEIQAEQLAWVEKGIEPQPVARDREATIILGPPAAGKSTIANDIAIARKAAIIDSDEIKKSIPGFDRGVGAKAVHEESSTLGKILTARMLDSGTNVIIPKVGDSVASILKQVDLLKESGYSVRIVNMAVSPDNAYRRMIGRFASTGRIIPPSYLDYVGAKPSAVYQELKARGVADGYAEIDNNGAFGAPKPTTEIVGQNPLEGSPFGLAQRGPEIGRAPDGVGAEPGRAVAAGVSPVTVTAEFTQAGEQMVIPGAERISDRELAERQAAEAMRGGQAALPEGGLFDETARAQQDLFADVNLDEEIPVSAIVDPQTGEIVPQTMTMRDLKQMLDEEDSFMDRLGYCTR